MLKDHNCQDVVSVAEASYCHAVRRAALRRGIVLPPQLSQESNEFPVNLVVTPMLPTPTKERLLTALEDIKFTKLQMNVKCEGRETNGKHTCYPFDVLIVKNRSFPALFCSFFIIH